MFVSITPGADGCKSSHLELMVVSITPGADGC